MRRAGVLLHVSSLPGPGPIGDLATARGFVLWLAERGLSTWQILPTNPVGPGRSPYASPSAFAGEASLLSIADLVVDGLLPPQDPPPGQGRVDPELLRNWKWPLLNQAADTPGNMQRALVSCHKFQRCTRNSALKPIYDSLLVCKGCLANKSVSVPRGASTLPN